MCFFILRWDEFHARRGTPANACHSEKSCSAWSVRAQRVNQCLLGPRVNRISIFLWIRNEWFRQLIMMIMSFVLIKLLVDVDSQPWPNPFKTIILAQSSLRSPGRMALARRPAIFSRPRDASAELVGSVENSWVKAARVIMDTSGQTNAIFLSQTSANQFFARSILGYACAFSRLNKSLCHIYIYIYIYILYIYICVCLFICLCIYIYI